MITSFSSSELMAATTCKGPFPTPSPLIKTLGKGKSSSYCSKKALKYSVIFICFPLFCQYLMGCNGKIMKKCAFRISHSETF